MRLEIYKVIKNKKKLNNKKKINGSICIQRTRQSYKYLNFNKILIVLRLKVVKN